MKARPVHACSLLLLLLLLLVRQTVTTMQVSSSAGLNEAAPQQEQQTFSRVEKAESSSSSSSSMCQRESTATAVKSFSTVVAAVDVRVASATAMAALDRPDAIVLVIDPATNRCVVSKQEVMKDVRGFVLSGVKELISGLIRRK